MQHSEVFIPSMDISHIILGAHSYRLHRTSRQPYDTLIFPNSQYEVAKSVDTFRRVSCSNENGRRTGFRVFVVNIIHWSVNAKAFEVMFVY